MTDISVAIDGFIFAHFYALTVPMLLALVAIGLGIRTNRF